MCFGRLIYGFTAGIIMCATPKMLEETIPANVAEKGFGTSTNIFINTGNFLCMMLAAWMPENGDELQTSKFWMTEFGV